MKLLVIGLNYWPELVGVGKYTGEMAASLAAAGHEVRVVTAPPYYPMWRRDEGWPRLWYQHERVALSGTDAGAVGSLDTGRLDIWRCPLYVPARPSGVTRLLHFASFALSSFPAALWQVSWHPQVVMAIAPTLFSAPAALFVARIARVPAWLHVQDFEVDAAFELGLLRAGLGRRFVVACERWLLRRFDRVSTISEEMRRRLLEKGVAQKRTVMLPNWVDTAFIHPAPEPSVFRAKLGIGAKRIVALYSGSMGEKHGLESVIDAARLLGEQPIDFVLCGDGPAKARLTELGRGLSNLRFLPLQPLSLLNDLLNLGDIHLLPQRADVADLVMPSKLTAMLASGRPVVATANPDTQVARTVSGCGLVVPPGDAAPFADAIACLAGDAALRATLGRAARARAKVEFSRTRVLAAFARELESFGG